MINTLTLKNTARGGFIGQALVVFSEFGASQGTPHGVTSIVDGYRTPIKHDTDALRPHHAAIATPEGRTF